MRKHSREFYLLALDLSDSASGLVLIARVWIPLPRKRAPVAFKFQTGVRSTNLSFLNFYTEIKFRNDVLADLTPVLVMAIYCHCIRHAGTSIASDSTM